jgi:diaminopimelate epimerase
MRFWKWHALGNSYVVVERAGGAVPLDPDLARRLCDLRRGIGADGVVEVLAAEEARAEIAIRTAPPPSSRATGPASPLPGSPAATVRPR